MKILKYFIFAQKNGTNIRKASIHTVDRILNIFSKKIDFYLKDYYRFNRLEKRSWGSNINMDESMFTHING